MADDSSDFPGWWAPYEIAAAVDRINDLETLFGADANPVYAMQALDIARLCSIPLPEWVLDWLGAGARRSMELLDQVCAGKSITNEADIVGRAFGFSAGRGETGCFERAASMERDERIFWRVVNETTPVKNSPGDKLNIAYDTVAVKFGLARSTIVKAATRHLRRIRPQ